MSRFRRVAAVIVLAAAASAVSAGVADARDDGHQSGRGAHQRADSGDEGGRSPAGEGGHGSARAESDEPCPEEGIDSVPGMGALPSLVESDDPAVTCEF